MSNDFFSTELPDLNGFIRELDLLDENVNEAVRDAMHEGNHVIAEEQHRLADETGIPFLAEHIREGELYATKSGGIGVTSGYMSEAFEKDAEGKNAGVIGLTYEFGRPGQSRTRSKDTMKQTRNGKTVEVSKGKISPRPHIRRGFDNKIREAADKTIKALERETGKVFNE